MVVAKLRQRSADYLCYMLLDTIVDHYFLVMEKLGDRIEDVEEEVAAGEVQEPYPILHTCEKS